MEEIEINSGINNEKIHRTFKVNKTKEDYLHLIANELREHGVDKEKCDDLGDLPEDLYLIFNPYKREEEKKHAITNVYGYINIHTVSSFIF